MKKTCSKTSRLKTLLTSKKIEFLMEAHNALSGQIVEEAGFAGIWASGLSMSSALGVRDSNEASWTQVLEVAEFMADATRIPILMDADTGYGNFNNVRRLVKKAEQRGIAGICIEDKLFPKTNSFINGEEQVLADIDEFNGKIKAAKDAQGDDDFCVVARIESFIAGKGLAETLKRAEAYFRAGADALLVHSKLHTGDQIVEFMREWKDTCPVVIVPTTYYSTPTKVYEDHGVSAVIWANHMVRTSIMAQQRTARKIFTERTLINVEDEIASVKEIFRLQGAEELLVAEKEYLPGGSAQTGAIVLAATRGREFGDLTLEKPKTMLPIFGEPLLARIVRNLKNVNANKITVVVGYKPEAVAVTGIEKVLNSSYAETGELFSLNCAKSALDGNVIVSYGDILYKRHILLELLAEQADIVLAVDGSRQWEKKSGRYTELVCCSRPFDGPFNTEPVTLEAFASNLDRSSISGEFIGLMRLSPPGAAKVRQALDELSRRPDFNRLRTEDLFQWLLKNNTRINVIYLDGPADQWLEIQEPGDIGSTLTLN